MRRSIRWMACGALAAVTALAAAGDAALGKEPEAAKASENVRWRRTYTDALLEARLRNLPILVTRHKDGCGRCERMHRNVILNKDFIAWSHDALVCFIAHNELGHPEEETTDSYGNKVKRCTRYPGLECRDHIDAAVDIDTARGDGLVKVPFLELCPNTWLVAPGDEVTQVPETSQFTVGKIKDQVEALQKTLGAAVPAKAWPALKEHAEKAQVALDDDKWKDALTHLAAMGASVKEPHASLKAWIDAGLQDIEEDATLAFEDLRDDKRLAAADKRTKIEALHASLAVDVLGARVPVCATIQAWLSAR
jgi:hypothetical protein